MSDEAHLPTEQSGPRTASRVPVAHGDGGRPQGPERSPRARPQEAQRLITLRKRADFVAANNKGRRGSTPGFLLLVRNRADDDPSMRVGFTVTKKIGNAVVRNRMKRRFRAIARDVVPAHGHPGTDHVIVGRPAGVEREFAKLRQELVAALDKLRK
jgi:ribonuclease P protein component